MRSILAYFLISCGCSAAISMLVKIILFKKANPSIDYTFLLNADNVLYFSVIGAFSTVVVFSVYGFLISI